MLTSLIPFPGVHSESRPPRHLLNIWSLHYLVLSIFATHSAMNHVGNRILLTPAPRYWNEAKSWPFFVKIAQKNVCKITSFLCSCHQITACPALALPFQALQASRSITENKLRPAECINMHSDHLLNLQGTVRRSVKSGESVLSSGYDFLFTSF